MPNQPVSLYRRLDQRGCDRALVLGVIADWYQMHDRLDEAKAVRWIMRSGKRPDDRGHPSHPTVWYRWNKRWPRGYPAGTTIGMTLSRHWANRGWYLGPRRISAAYMDLVRAWCRCVEEKRRNVAQRKGA